MSPTRQNSQEKVFLKGEGDRYFERNRGEVIRKETLDFYARFLRPGSEILEIGCSNGANLNYLSQKVQCKCFGVDPSSEAIRSGVGKFQGLDLSVGTAEKLHFPDERFDFVFFGFCLYLVDRHNLAKAVAEADRVLKDKGFLGIMDFDEKIPRKRPYKHCSGINSYKMDYSSLFLAYPHYSLVEKHSFSHASSSFVEDVSKRVSVVMMFKDHASAYFPEADCL